MFGGTCIFSSCSQEPTVISYQKSQFFILQKLKTNLKNPLQIVTLNKAQISKAVGNRRIFVSRDCMKSKERMAPFSIKRIVAQPPNGMFPFSLHSCNRVSPPPQAYPQRAPQPSGSGGRCLSGLKEHLTNRLELDIASTSPFIKKIQQLLSTCYNVLH